VKATETGKAARSNGFYTDECPPHRTHPAGAADTTAYRISGNPSASTWRFATGADFLYPETTGTRGP
jgi:hypothetical protein